MLIDRAMLAGQGDVNADGEVTIQEAFGFAEREAPAYTASQSNGPQHPVLRGGDGTAWFLDEPPPPPPEPKPKNCGLICL
jgi:hypothetical protein